jgi:hypothetical protein
MTSGRVSAEAKRTDAERTATARCATGKATTWNALFAKRPPAMTAPLPALNSPRPRAGIAFVAIDRPISHAATGGSRSNVRTRPA